VIEKGLNRWCQVDTASSSRQELGAHLVYKIPNLPAQRRLGRVQFSLCRDRQASCVGNRDEIAKMS
jgi:hypothetical protein